jgi:hypothetical protein
MRAGGLFRVMLCDGENLREGFFAGVADELIVGIYTSHVLWMIMARF